MIWQYGIQNNNKGEEQSSPFLLINNLSRCNFMFKYLHLSNILFTFAQ